MKTLSKSNLHAFILKQVYLIRADAFRGAFTLAYEK